MHLAEVSVLTVAAMMLSVFDISEPRNKDGVPLHPGNAEYTGGTIRCVLRLSLKRKVLSYAREIASSHPNPFTCTIAPRSEKAKALILAAARA